MLRTMLLAASALPVVFASMSLADWAREDPNSGAERNTVWRNNTVPAGSAPDPHADQILAQACQRQADSWASRLGPNYSVMVQTPFVLVGNISAEALSLMYHETVQPASTALQRLYFSAVPDTPITLMLLEDETSYRACASRLFGRQNVSIYGYYKPSTRTVVINLAAGDGTVVHELVHALVDFDFPEIPIWLNEGLASLYEHCELSCDLGGPQIQPLVNWRLEVLHEAMANGQLRPLSELLRSTQIRGPGEAVNYAQARYLCMFLHESGLLERYYHQLQRDWLQDPTGMESLSAVFGGQSISTIEQAFREWSYHLQSHPSATR